jgi:hypothetical protein
MLRGLCVLDLIHQLAWFAEVGRLAVNDELLGKHSMRGHDEHEYDKVLKHVDT